MTERDDQPLSSEEMIRQAREGLDQGASLSDIGIDRAEIEERVEEAMPSPAQLVEPPRSTRRQAARPRRVVDREVPPTGFGGSERQSQKAISLAIALALLIMGVAVFLALASSAG